MCVCGVGECVCVCSVRVCVWGGCVRVNGSVCVLKVLVMPWCTRASEVYGSECVCIPAVPLQWRCK